MIGKLYLKLKWWVIDKITEHVVGIKYNEYWCRRCESDVKEGRCKCSTSPSPWELKR